MTRPIAIRYDDDATKKEKQLFLLSTLTLLARRVRGISLLGIPVGCVVSDPAGCPNQQDILPADMKYDDNPLVKFLRTVLMYHNID